MRALSIRQPCAELIPSTYSGQALRGIKTVEYRSGATRMIGERFYIYASKGHARPSDDGVAYDGQEPRTRPMAHSRIQSRLLWVTALAVVGACACATLYSNRRSASAGRASTAPAPPATTPATAAATGPSGALLTVTVKDLRNKKGDLIFGVFVHADGFPNVKAKSIYWEVKPADADAVTFTTRLPAGRYAAGVLHDENRSGDTDKGLAGVPLEGYGVTNNPKPRLRKATFEEAIFTLPPEGAKVTISLQYF